MLELLLAIYGFIVLVIWAHFDENYGDIPAVYVTPFVLGLLAIFYFLNFTSIYIWLILFSLFVGIYWFSNRILKQKFGFADVVGLPFGLSIVFTFGIFMWIGFALFLAFQVLFFDKLPEKLTGKRDIKNNMRFLPLIFNAYVVGVLIAWII